MQPFSPTNCRTNSPRPLYPKYLASIPTPKPPLITPQQPTQNPPSLSRVRILPLLSTHIESPSTTKIHPLPSTPSANIHPLLHANSTHKLRKPQPPLTLSTSRPRSSDSRSRAVNITALSVKSLNFYSIHLIPTKPLPFRVSRRRALKEVGLDQTRRFSGFQGMVRWEQSDCVDTVHMRTFPFRDLDAEKRVDAQHVQKIAGPYSAYADLKETHKPLQEFSQQQQLPSQHSSAPSTPSQSQHISQSQSCSSPAAYTPHSQYTAPACPSHTPGHAAASA